MEKYENPVMEIVELDGADVVTTSFCPEQMPEAEG